MNKALVVKRGDTWKWPFYFFTKDESGNKVSLDLTDCSARLMVKPKRGEAVLYAAPPSDPPDETVNGEVIIIPADGLVTVLFPVATTLTVRPGEYLSDLEVTWADGTVQSSATFAVIVEEDMTI
jgi:hypothetical protein